MRDVKRDRYAKKELVKLKECAERLQKTKDSCISAAELASSSLYQLVTPEAAAKDAKPPTAAEMDVEMEAGSSNNKKKSFGKTDKNGQYPVWMSQRNVKRLQKKNGKKKQQKKKNKAPK